MSVTPCFLFKIRTMRQRTNVPEHQLLDNHGQWFPPKKLGDNRRRASDGDGLDFTCNSEQVLAGWPYQPDVSHHYKTISIYVCGDVFHMVDYDATVRRVGNGRNGTHNGSDSESEESDDTATGSNDHGRARNGMDWHRMKFLYNEADGSYASYATYDMTTNARLRTQREDQLWINRILPEAYHAQYPSWTRVQEQGGLNGELPLLLALVGFAVEPLHVRNIFPACFVRGRWNLNMIERFTPPHGRMDRRGLVISVYTCPPYSDHRSLQLYERGEFGRVFD